MLTTARQKRDCAKYGARDENGKVHCYECPQVIDRDAMTCRKFMHWDRKKQEWVHDDEQKG